MEAVMSPYIVLKKSAIHNTGVFAGMGIQKGTRIIEYVGEKITSEEGDARSERHIKMSNGSRGAVYVFEFDENFDIDGSSEYNTARYINHSCSPNCMADIGNGHIWIVALRDIKAGEELTYNYLYDLEDFEDHPCRCGSENCVGYILDEKYWPELQRTLSLVRK